jgi:hypothetical protein
MFRAIWGDGGRKEKTEVRREKREGRWKGYEKIF